MYLREVRAPGRPVNYRRSSCTVREADYDSVVRVIVLGGTRFIGRAIVGVLVDAGHDVLVSHRGDTEPIDMPPVAHLHAERGRLREHQASLDAFKAGAVVDCLAMSARDARAALDALPNPSPKSRVLSSQDVYRAFATLQCNGLATDAVPITEEDLSSGACAPDAV
jgi:NAD(P)-dependent dehydrogenase (short-subunit alcohol dehydrogenase family)